MFDDEGASQQQLVCARFDNAEVLQQVEVGDAFLSVQQVVNIRPVAAELREETADAWHTETL